MSAKLGRDMLVKIKNDQDAFIRLAGLRTKGLRFNARTVDVTHSESADAWRELLPGAGVKTAEISGEGCSPIALLTRWRAQRFSNKVQKPINSFSRNSGR